MAVRDSPALHPLDELPCHDPFVVTVDDGYLLFTSFDSARWERQIPAGTTFATPPGAGVVSWWSPDLLMWGDPQVVFSVPEDCWADPAVAPWAPEVHRWTDPEGKQRWLLATTLHQPADRLDSVRQRGTSITMSSTGRYSFDPIRRGTVLAVADDPRGPFALLDPTRSTTPTGFMALDGTLTRDRDGQLWMVYAHEWVQIVDGTIEAIRLDDQLRPHGTPVHLFRGSEASWYRGLTPSVTALAPYVTDGPQLWPLPGGGLSMLWASYRPDLSTGEYVETQAISPSGSLLGPWQQGPVLVGGNAGHGMVFTTHDDQLAMVLHRGMNTPRVRAEIHRIEATPTGLRVIDRLA